ncbi:DUF3108 domain-containing protein [Candidatus Fermentibacteria bacterium]|nr:DUF3108 domain-containing protein [Candidatus Fermentibacteria bacterium]
MVADKRGGSGVSLLVIVLALLLGAFSLDELRAPAHAQSASEDSVAMPDSSQDFTPAQLAPEDSVAMPDSSQGPVPAGLSCPGRVDSVVNRAFGLGERLVFAVRYAGITAGSSTLSVDDTTRIDGHLCYVINNRTQSSKEFSIVYKVDDRATAWFDMENFVSRGFEKHLREGDFKTDQQVWFHQERNVARYPSKNLEIETPPCVMDILSSIYYVRMLPLEVGAEVVFDNHENRKNYPLVVKVLRKEQVKVDAGFFSCVVVEPVLREPGLFKHKGKLWVWLTDDETHMPVLMKSKIPVGSVKVTLVDYQRGERGDG